MFSFLKNPNPQVSENHNPKNYTKYFGRSLTDVFSIKKPKYVINQRICIGKGVQNATPATICDLNAYHYSCELPTLFTTPSCIYIDINKQFTEMIPKFWIYHTIPHNQFIFDFYNKFQFFCNMLGKIHLEKTTSAQQINTPAPPLSKTSNTKSSSLFSSLKTASAVVTSKTLNYIEDTSLSNTKNDLLKNIAFFDNYVKYVNEFKEKLNSSTPYFDNKFKFNDNYKNFTKLTLNNAMLNPEDETHNALLKSIGEIIIDIKGDMYIYQLNHLVEYKYKKTIGATELSPNAPETIFEVRTESIKSNKTVYDKTSENIQIPLTEFEKNTNKYGKLYSSLKMVIDIYDSAVNTLNEAQQNEKANKIKENRTGFKVPTIRVYKDGETFYPVIMRTVEYTYYVLTDITPKNKDDEYIYPKNETANTQPASSKFEAKSIFEVIQSLYLPMMDEYHLKSKTILDVLYKELTELNKKIQNIKTEFIHNSTTDNMDWLPDSKIKDIYDTIIKPDENRIDETIAKINLEDPTNSFNSWKENKEREAKNKITSDIIKADKLKPFIDQTFRNKDSRDVTPEHYQEKLNDFMSSLTVDKYKKEWLTYYEKKYKYPAETDRNGTIVKNKLENICTRYRTELFGINAYTEHISNVNGHKIQIKLLNIYNDYITTIRVKEQKTYSTLMSSNVYSIEYYPWCKKTSITGAVVSLARKTKNVANEAAEKTDNFAKRTGQVVKATPTIVKNLADNISTNTRQNIDSFNVSSKHWKLGGGSTRKTHRSKGNRTRKYKHVHKETRNTVKNSFRFASGVRVSSRERSSKDIEKRHANKQNTRKTRKH